MHRHRRAGPVPLAPDAPRDELGQRQAEIRSLVRSSWEQPRDDALPVLYEAFDALSVLEDRELNRYGAIALRLIGRFVRINEGQRDLADAALNRAESWLRAHEELDQLVLVLAERGESWHGDVGLGASMQQYAQALALSKQLPTPLESCSVWNSLGKRLIDAGLHAEAAQCHEQVLRLAEGRTGDRWDAECGVALVNLSWTQVLGGQFDQALHSLDRWLALIDRSLAAAPSPRAMAAVYENRACALLGQARADEALSAARNAKKWADASQSAYCICGAELVLARALAANGRRDEGFGLLQATVQRCRREVPKQLVNALWTAAQVFEDERQPQAAGMYLHELFVLKQASQSRLAEQLQVEAGQLLAQAPRIESLQVAPLTLERARTLQFDDGARDALSSLNLLLEEHAVAAERLDDTTGAHCYRVGRLAALLGRRIGLGQDVCFLMDLAARLHDVGKLAVPDAILMKRSFLTPGERQIMQRHTLAGSELLARARVPQMHIAQEIARHHHERWDGTGYPDGLVGSAIPISARATALADVFDALTHARPYKSAWPVDEALAEIVSLRGSHFDPALTDVFLELVAELRAEHGDLDAVLEAEAFRSRFISARDEVARQLKGDDPLVSHFGASGLGADARG